jgi:hypothetical protein
MKNPNNKGSKTSLSTSKQFLNNSNLDFDDSKDIIKHNR